MGSHMRLIDPSEPPWLLNQSVKLTLSKALTLRIPPSGSTNALTTGDVPSAKELAACVQHRECHLDDAVMRLYCIVEVTFIRPSVSTNALTGDVPSAKGLAAWKQRRRCQLDDAFLTCSDETLLH